MDSRKTGEVLISSAAMPGHWEPCPGEHEGEAVPVRRDAQRHLLALLAVGEGGEARDGLGAVRGHHDGPVRQRRPGRGQRVRHVRVRDLGGPPGTHGSGRPGRAGPRRPAAGDQPGQRTGVAVPVGRRGGSGSVAPSSPTITPNTYVLH
ncbi:hypothetical protein GCM10020221_01200 [Streptomyces thioluteus]|uniref:Uncharacterized protein n=1 Tax=Streptomyces thioluteus TaxID=66431 RepID=A0ABN3WA90_STRTU